MDSISSLFFIFFIVANFFHCLMPVYLVAVLIHANSGVLEVTGDYTFLCVEIMDQIQGLIPANI